MEVNDLLIKYFNKNCTHEEIRVILLQKHNIRLSVTTIKRKLHTLNLKRKNPKENNLEDILFAVIEEVHACGYNLGYRSLWQKLKKKYNLIVKRETVYKLLKIVDPDGVAERFGHRLHRREYLSPGPNFLWHLDGYDKLRQFGFAIHGCIDGFSRQIIWFGVGTTNNNPKVVAYHFLNHVKKLKFVPEIIRSDKGTENSLLGLLQICLRYRHSDENAGEKSYIQGKSTRNQRIESFWGRMRQHSADFFIQLFKCMQEKNLFQGTKLHIQCLQYCFGPLIRYELNAIRELWNEHRIRKQAARKNLAGRPFMLFNVPEKFCARNYNKSVNVESVQRLIDRFTVKPQLFSNNISELVKLLLPEHSIPTSPEEAVLFVMEPSTLPYK